MSPKKLQNLVIKMFILCALCLSALVIAPSAEADAGPTLTADQANEIFKTGPQTPSLDHVLKALGAGYAIQMTLDAKPVRDAGVIERVFKLVPEANEKYTAFVKDSGFDPIARFQGGLLAADAPHLGDLDLGERMLLVFQFDGGVTQATLEALDQLDKKSDSKDKKAKQQSDIVVLVPLDGGARQTLVDEMKASVEKKGVDKIIAVDTGSADTKLMFRTNIKKESMDYAYVWSGGLVIGSFPSAGGAMNEATAKERAAQMISRLDTAAKATIPTNMLPAITLRTPLPEGSNLNMSMNLQPDFAFDGQLKLGGEMLKNSDQFMLGFSMIKASPDEFLGKKVPPPFHPMVKLLLAGTDIKIEGDVASATVRAPFADLMKEVDAILATMGK